MAIDFLERSDAIEECYEFLLGYAAQGLPSDQGSPAGREVRTHLEHARNALIELPESCRRAIVDHQLEASEKYDAFCSMLERDVRDSLVAIELVLDEFGHNVTLGAAAAAAAAVYQAGAAHAGRASS